MGFVVRLLRGFPPMARRTGHKYEAIGQFGTKRGGALRCASPDVEGQQYRPAFGQHLPRSGGGVIQGTVCCDMFGQPVTGDDTRLLCYGLIHEP